MHNNPKAVNALVYGLFVLCAGLFVADFFYHKKVYVAVEEFPGFYALFGFVACVVLVMSAKGLRALVKRHEGYYAPLDVESEDYPEDQLERVDRDG